MDLPRSFGPYTLTTRLAVGGMAEVYVAKTQGLGGFEKEVALKVVHPHLAEDEHFVRMLIDEAKVLVQLNHANIAQVLDLGHIGQDYYIAMEFVDGWELHTIVTAARDLKTPLPPEMAAFVMAEVCSGLDHAHHKHDEQGRPLNLVHRDVSPQNILISRTGSVKLVDFGIAKGTHRGEGTEVGVIKGKYNYMSPEQAWADPVDRRSDVFAAGIVIWEMLVGRMLYRCPDVPRLIAEVREAEVPPPRGEREDVPEFLSRIVLKATAKDQADRYQSAGDLAEALRDFLYQRAPGYGARTLAEQLDDLMGAHARMGEQVTASRGTQLKAVLTRSDLPPGRGSILPANQVFPSASVSGPSTPAQPTVRPRAAPRSIPPLPFDSIPPPTDRMAMPPDFQAERVSSWPPAPMSGEPGTNPTIELRPRSSRPAGASSPPRPAVSDPSSHSWSGGPIQVDGTPERTLVDGSSALKAAAADLLDDVAVTAPGGVPVLGPGFDSEPTGRYKGQDLADLPRGLPPSAQRAQSRAMPPPPSGEEPLTEVPPAAPLPDVEAETRRMYRRRRLQQVLMFFTLGAIVSLVVALVVRTPGGPAAPALLEILSVPGGAHLAVDGKEQPGVTPMRLDNFRAGKDYELRLTLDGYRPWEGTFHAAAGVVQHIAVLKAHKAELFIRTEPPGASLWIDGVRVGESPLKISDMDPGRSVRVRASRAGYQTQETVFEIKPDALRPKLRITLEPGTGR